MGGWGCPHEIDGKCAKVNELPCDPGMKGCILFGRFVFSDEAKNRSGGPRRRSHGKERDGSDDKAG
jgi:hypothetical protein